MFVCQKKVFSKNSILIFLYLCKPLIIGLKYQRSMTLGRDVGIIRKYEFLNK